MTRFVIHLLGPPRVTWSSGTPPRFRSPTAQAILAYLLLAGQPVARAKLLTLFWPDTPAKQAQAELRRVLHNLRRMLPEAWEITRKTVALSTSADVVTDLDQLSRLVEDGKWSEAALVAGGNFLEGVAVPESAAFESWLLAEREHWRQKVERILDRASQDAMQQGDFDAALRYTQQHLQVAPWREKTYRTRMWLLAHCGQFSAALKQYEQCRTVLAHELDVLPSLATTRLQESIKAAMALPAHRLPRAFTPFWGREAELALLRRHLLDPACRLLTLTGLGGVGKSRLSLELARQIAGDDVRFFLHGLVFVSLVDVSAADLVAAVGAALDLRFSGEMSAKKQLLNYLGELELLLILDNYEHLLPTTELVTAILEAAPDIKLLITSRERLHLREEWVVPVAGLPFPGETVGRDVDQQHAQLASVRLFLSCAARHGYRTVGEPQDRSALADVTAICRLLHGLPLALELAAAQLANRSSAALLSQLEQGLDVLRSDMRNLPPRQASMRATFELSWTALTGREQWVAMRLALFHGGWTAEAAAEIAAASEAVVESLWRKSLIVRLETGRYTMHELLRHFMVEKLAVDPAAHHMAKQQHALYYAERLRTLEKPLLATHQVETLNLLRPDTENILAAWRWLSARAETEVLSSIVWPLAWLFHLRGRIMDGLQLIGAALEDQDNALMGREPLLLGRLLLFQANFLYLAGQLRDAADKLATAAARLAGSGTAEDRALAAYLTGVVGLEQREPGWRRHVRQAYALAQKAGSPWLVGYVAPRLAYGTGADVGRANDPRDAALLQEAGTIGEELDNPSILFNALYTAGRAASHSGDFRRAEQLLNDALAAAERLDNPWLVGIVSYDLGGATFRQQRFETAKAHCERSRTLFHRIGARRQEAALFNFLGEIMRGKGADADAVRNYQRSLAILAELGQWHNTYWVSCNLGHVCLRLTQIEAAQEQFHYCLSNRKIETNPLLSGMVLAGAAGTLVLQGQPAVAAQLGGAAAAQFAAAEETRQPADEQDWQRIVAALEAAIAPGIFQQGWGAGQSLAARAAFSMALRHL